MKTVRFTLVAAVIAFPAMATNAQTTVPGGLIANDTTWTVSGSPYQLASSVLVASGATLTIEPGTTVVSAGDVMGRSITIGGIIIAEGTAGAPIELKGVRLVLADTSSPASRLSFVNIRSESLLVKSPLPALSDCVVGHSATFVSVRRITS